MTAGRVALADFLERSRQYNYMVTLVVMLWVAWIFMPAKDAGYVTIDLDGWRGVYNSAWVGTSVALLTAVFLALFGFYLVKNALERDRRSGVGEMLAATVLSSRSYLLGKWLSNVLVLGSFVLVLIIAAGALQFVRAEDTVLDLPALVTPFLLVTFPVMALVAAFAVLFETIPFLRGAFGNVAWFFLWVGLIVNPPTLVSAPSKTSTGPNWLDAGGTGLIIEEILDAGSAHIANFNRSNYSIGINIGPQNRETFVWEGIDWTGAIAASRAAWLVVAIGIVLVAVPFFDRFDPARAGFGRGRLRRKVRSALPDPNGAAPAPVEGPVVEPAAGLLVPGRFEQAGSGPAVAVRPGALNLLPMTVAELRMALKGFRPWWYLVAAGLVVAGVFAPLSVAIHLWPFSWIWPLPAWSAMGCREKRFGTGDLLASSPRPLARQLPAAILAGLTIAIVTGAAIGLRQVLAGDLPGFSAWLAGALFIPAFAYAAGAWTGSGKFFEVSYLLLWYAGPLQGFGPLDFMGTTPAAIESGAPGRFLGLAALFLALGVVRRARH